MTEYLSKRSSLPPMMMMMMMITNDDWQERTRPHCDFVEDPHVDFPELNQDVRFT